MGHEKEIFTHIADARTKLAGARDLKGKVDAARELDGAFARLLAVVENYPNLKANETFQRLMDELSGTENRIAVERMRYNERVREYNITIKRFPGNVFASWFKRKEAPYFKAKKKEKKVPEVKF
jgi:LemA protein